MRDNHELSWLFRETPNNAGKNIDGVISVLLPVSVGVCLDKIALSELLRGNLVGGTIGLLGSVVTFGAAYVAFDSFWPKQPTE